MANFHFFTDPTKLADQLPEEAFGPAGAVDGKDRFRVTDVHKGLGVTAPAYAVCHGHIRVQAVYKGDDIDSLTLILRPLKQPPFEFPYVEYYIYRGLRPSSLLKSTKPLDLADKGPDLDRDLIGFIHDKVLTERPKGKKPIEKPPAKDGGNLGLDRVPGVPADNRWADDQPLDHLFRYGRGIEVPMVGAGWTLGEFGETFGFDVVVQHYGAQPTIGWARSAEAWIEGYPPGVASRMQREAIGCFVDPCAFWGMFFPAGLSLGPARAKPKEVVTKKEGDLHLALFVPKIFANRDRIYLDVRNEVGLSYDFYGTRQDGLQTGLDQAPLAETTYAQSGWPIHFVDPDLEKIAAPASLSFRLRRNDTAEPLVFLRQTGQASPPNDRFLDIIESGDPTWAKSITLTRPGSPGALPPWWFVVHYLRGQSGGAAQVPAGVLDSTLPQLGPIGDRSISAYRELWPVEGAGPSAARTLSLIATDKVLRYDAVKKDDPTAAGRGLFYGHMAETAYVFRKGMGTEQGMDSVLIVQSHGFDHRHVTTGNWTLPKPLDLWSASDLLVGQLVRRLLADPVTVPLATGDTVIHSSFDMLNDTAIKTDLFDFTILLLSRADFEAAVNAVAPAGAAPPGPGMKHPIFFSLGPPAEQPPGTLAYQLQWQGWDVEPKAGPATLILSADGAFFCSPDFNAKGLGGVPKPTTAAECPFAALVPIRKADDPYQSKKAPYRIVHHTTQGPTMESAVSTYQSEGNYPHFTVDDTRIYQHLTIHKPTTALLNCDPAKNPDECKKAYLTVDERKEKYTYKELLAIITARGYEDGLQTNNLYCVQIELIGTAYKEKTKQILMNVARLCRWIENELGIPRTWPAGLPTLLGGPTGLDKRNVKIWSNQGGHYGHCHVPENYHTDPGYTEVEVDFLMNATFTDGLLDNPNHPKVEPLLLRKDP